MLRLSTRYDTKTIEEFNVDSKAECDQLNLAPESKTNKRQYPFSTVQVQNPRRQTLQTMNLSYGRHPPHLHPDPQRDCGGCPLLKAFLVIFDIYLHLEQTVFTLVSLN